MKTELKDFNLLFNGDDSEDIEQSLIAGINRSGMVSMSEIDIDLIDSFPNHPFYVEDDENMEKLAEHIKEYGVLHPVLVRRSLSGRYQMISGHRRCYASKKAGKESIPARILNISEEEATILMTDANFLQRDNMKISEKAKAYRMKYDAIKSQGVKGSGNSLETMGENTKESAKTVQRLIRMSYLNDDLLYMADSGKIALLPGVELSYLNEEEQKMVVEALRITNKSISKDQATRIHKADNLTMDIILDILRVQPKRSFTLKNEQIDQFFTSDEDNEFIEKTIIELLKQWKEIQNHE